MPESGWFRRFGSRGWLADRGELPESATQQASALVVGLLQAIDRCVEPLHPRLDLQ